MILYVALTASARGGGPKVGAARWDVPVEVPDRSEDSYEGALAEASRRYEERFGKGPGGPIHFGTYRGKTESSE